MPGSSSSTEATPRTGLEALAAELHQQSGGAAWGLSAADFAGILHAVATKYAAADASTDAVRALWRSLKLEELALARACAAGNEKAWEVFLTRFREKLYEAARAIARDDSTGRELADSLYAELYGLETRDGQRRSKLNYYTGRGSLEGWLRTVLAQDYINRYRSQKRLVSLEEEEEAGVQFAAKQADPPSDADPRLAAATDEELAALNAEDRFVLASYFLDGQTLAEIARTLSVHESTISRRVERTTVSLRKAIRQNLERRGMSRRQAEEALAADVRDITVPIRERLTQESPGSAFSTKKEAPAKGRVGD